MTGYHAERWRTNEDNKGLVRDVCAWTGWFYIRLYTKVPIRERPNFQDWRVEFWSFASIRFSAVASTEPTKDASFPLCFSCECKELLVSEM